VILCYLMKRAEANNRYDCSKKPDIDTVH